MRKIDPKHEHPIDDAILCLSDVTNPLWKSMKFTPNTLTTFSTVFGLMAVRYLYKERLLLFSICLIISSIFDYFDGHYARTYNMTTEFGDMYDHIKDISVGLMLVVILIYKSYKTKPKALGISMMFLAFLSFGMTWNLSCQDKMCDKAKPKEYKNFLDYINVSCSRKEDIKYSKVFGTAMFVMFGFILSAYILIDK